MSAPARGPGLLWKWEEGQGALWGGALVLGPDRGSRGLLQLSSPLPGVPGQPLSPSEALVLLLTAQGLWTLRRTPLWKEQPDPSVTVWPLVGPGARSRAGTGLWLLGTRPLGHWAGLLPSVGHFYLEGLTF